VTGDNKTKTIQPRKVTKKWHHDPLACRHRTECISDHQEMSLAHTWVE